MNKIFKNIIIAVLFATVLCSQDAYASWLTLVKGTGKIATKTASKTSNKIVQKGIKKLSPTIVHQTAKNFGKQNLKYIKNIPASDLRRLNAYAGKAGDQATKNALMSYYKKGGTKFLNKLTWKQITATGLSLSMVIAAYQVSDGIQSGMDTIAQDSPEVFGNTVHGMIKWLTFPFVLAAGLFFGGKALISLFSYYKKKTGQNIYRWL